MVILTRITISKPNSPKKRILLRLEDIINIQERSDERDKRVTALITYKTTGSEYYQTQVIHVVDKMSTIERRIQREEKKKCP